MTVGDNRSITGRDFTNTINVTGSNNLATARMTQHPLPSPETVNAGVELAALRDLISKLNVPERGKLDRAMQDATEEAAKPDPDKEEVASAVGRVVKYVKAAEEFGEHAEKLLPRILALGSWLGAHGTALLALAGITP